jgi:hypothetical protein
MRAGVWNGLELDSPWAGGNAAMRPVHLPAVYLAKIKKAVQFGRPLDL